MPDGLESLNAAALELLFRTIEGPSARIAGSALQDHFEAAAHFLRSTGLLVRDGHASAAAAPGDHDDAPVELLWPDSGEGLAYPTSTGETIKADSERISYFRVDFMAVLPALVSNLIKPDIVGPQPLLEDLVWELGGATIVGRRTTTVSIWFARRLHDHVVRRSVEQLAARQPATGLRIVLTSTPADRLNDMFIWNNSIISVRSMLQRGRGLAIDPVLLAAGLSGPGADDRNGPIRHSPDFGTISIGDKDYRFNGIKQRSILRQLIEAYKARHPDRLTSEILFEAKYNDSINTLAKAFSGRIDWKEFIAEKGGRCWVFYNPVE